MGKPTHSKLPRAQVAHRHRGVAAVFAALLGLMARIRIGRSEVVAVSIAGSIVVLAGLMLAGFGAANPQGLADRYTASALPNSAQEEATPVNDCSYSDFDYQACVDIWKRGLAAGYIHDFDDEGQWLGSECRVTLQCYERTQARNPSASALD